MVASGRVDGEVVNADLSQLVGEGGDRNEIFTRMLLFILVAPLLDYDRTHTLVEGTDGLEIVFEGKVKVRYKVLTVSQLIECFTV